MRQRLRGIDILGLIFATACLFEVGLALLIRQPLAQILEDMKVNLPHLATFMMKRGAVVVAGLAPMTLILEGTLRKRSEANQLTRCVVAIVVMIGLLAGIADLIRVHLAIHYCG